MGVYHLDSVSASSVMGGGFRPEITQHYQQCWGQIANTGLGHIYQQEVDRSSALWLSEESIARQKSAMRITTALLGSDMIHQLTSIEAMQFAKPMMRNYLMADPDLYQLYREDKIDGYEGKFEYDPNLTISENPYYRAMNDGWGRLEGEDIVFESFDNTSEELDYSSQQAIHDSILLAKHYIELQEDDPTSYLGNSL